MNNPKGPATDAQRNFIADLIERRITAYRVHATQIESDVEARVARRGEEARHDARHEIREAQAARTLEEVYRAITVPSELTKEQASRWIEFVKSNNQKIVELALANPTSAARFGLATMIAERRDEIETAMRLCHVGAR